MLSSLATEIVVRDEEGTVTLPARALQDGTVLVDNEFSVKDGVVQCPHDLITLTHLHEPAVVHCLNLRYQQDTIYTATGPVLLALNPFKTCRGLYSEGTMKRYWERAERNLQLELPPHVFDIADQSFRSMMRLIDESLGKDATERNNCDQSILVSGESGAGKTVTTKYVMKYLAALSQRASLEKPQRAYQKVQQQRMLSPSAVSSHHLAWKIDSQAPDSPTAFQPNSIESQVLQSNPILESFGNARTLRNDNSSRFGKFIQIQFTASGKLVGATIETYLLEKVRLVTQSLGERNYHVFFELLAGMPAAELRNYCVASTATPEDFSMTNSGTFDRRDGVSDKETYTALRTAMNAMKFPIEEQREIFGITCALLHASNLTFGEVDHDQAMLETDNVHLEPVCLLLGVTPEDLNDSLCSFSITAGRDGSVRRKVSRPKAEKGLEALIKATYGALFTHLVRKINDSIAFKDTTPEDEEPVDEWSKPAASIGVLDIFGFESFMVNSFEQLCINYCNEALQQQFNAFVLKNEQEEYEREGIEWYFIEFPENQDVLDLIDKRGSGILNILDDQCRAPGTTDRSFASDVYSKCAGLSRFKANRKQVAVLQFEVQHYAGPVEYTTEGFVEKNRDELPKESTELLSGSANPFAQHLAAIIMNPASTPPPLNSEGTTTMSPYSLHRTDSSLAARMTVGGQFRRQLRDLRSKIDLTCPHYVRCLKPNDNLIPDHFDEMVVAEQLRCGGILEVVRVSRAGFTQHYPHADFVRRYRSLTISELESLSNIV
jgi:myosin-5